MVTVITANITCHAVADICEYDNETSGSTKGEEFLTGFSRRTLFHGVR